MTVGRLQEKHLSSPNSEVSMLALPEKEKTIAVHSLHIGKGDKWGQGELECKQDAF